jgi:SAM-dependent methyltransferase
MMLQVATSTDYTVADQERMKLAGQYFQWQHRMAESQLGSRVLEVGCGLGNFTRLLTDRELIVAIDADSACIDKLREAMPDRENLITLHMDIMNPSALILKKYWLDTIVCLNVLEHIPDDSRTLANMHQILVAGGKVVLIVPAFQSLYGPIDSKLGHYRRYTKKTLRLLAKSVGFETVVVRYINSVGCLGWWLNAHVLRKTEQSEFQIRLFDQYVVPPLSWLEDRIEPPFGQSIFSVLVKT